MKRVALLFAACLVVALPLRAADDSRKGDAHMKTARSDTVQVKTTVEAIDHTNRTLTLKEKDGDLVTVYAAPDVQGFDTLNVGDKVSLQYREAVALQLHKTDDRDRDRTTTSPSGGDPGGAPYDSPSGSTTGSETGVTGTPAGMTAAQVTTLATVKDVDTRDQEITFQTEDGRMVSARLDDRDLVKDIDPGDQIEVTYTNPVLVSVEKS